MKPRINIVDIQQKFKLKKLHKKSRETRSITCTTTGIVAILVAALILFLYRKSSNHRNEHVINKTIPRINVRFTDLLSERIEADLEQQTNDPSRHKNILEHYLNTQSSNAEHQ